MLREHVVKLDLAEPDKELYALLHKRSTLHELCGKQVAFNAEIDGMWSREDYIPTQETRALQLAQKDGIKAEMSIRLSEPSSKK